MAYYGALQSPTFFPAVRDILSITNGSITTVTTTFDGSTPGNHGYVSGTIVRLIIPPYFGMEQINQAVRPITVTSPSTFTMLLDSTGFDSFSIPPQQPGHCGTPAQVVPIGELTEQLTASFVNILPPQ